MGQDDSDSTLPLGFFMSGVFVFFDTIVVR